MNDRECETTVLPATDPANPWGNALSWPETPDTGRPQRVAGARVFVTNGQLSGYLNRNRDQLITFAPGDHRSTNWRNSLAHALADEAQPRRSLLLAKVDGKTPGQSDLSDALLAAGFASTTKGYLHKGQSHDAGR